jgi:AcrR family transcriptional regulator
VLSSARGLTLELIVDEAAAVVAEDGFDALSMRRLAARLGVGAMTLYGYVPTKEALLGELANRFLAEIALPDPKLPWQERIAALFGSARQVFLEHPALIPIVASQRIDNDSAYRGAEVVFAALDEAGLPGDQVISGFDALVSFTIGSTLRESGGARVRAPLGGIAELGTAGHGHVIELADRLAGRDPEHEFEAGLKLLISGFEAAGTR